MVKGPFQITDLINMHMGTGWILYGCWPNRLAYEGRKKLRGFYTQATSSTPGIRSSASTGTRILPTRLA